MAALALLFLSLLPLTANAQADSTAMAALGRKLGEYVAALEQEPVPVKCEETDFLISSCKDSLTRQFTALKLYTHYITSRLMGDEGVAIHICDRWFIPGKVKMKSETDLMTAKLFATFNRSSLIGRKAPELDMTDTSGRMYHLFGEGWSSDRMTVLYFYDSGCPRCLVESLMLKGLVEEGEHAFDLYAIYTQPEEEKWKSYIRERLDFDNPEIRVTHLWDPEISSDFQMKYGLLQTPGMFLISKDGTILGRKLDTPALEQLLDIYEERDRSVYGSEESAAFYDSIFIGTEGFAGCGEISGMIDMIAQKTLAARDTGLYKQMCGDMLHYLGNRREEDAKCALSHLTRDCILDRSDIWNTADDSLKVVSYAEILDDLLHKPEKGKKLPQISVNGEWGRKGRWQEKRMRLDKLKGTTVLFFTEHCKVCQSELEKVRQDSLSRYFIIDVDETVTREPETASTLFGKFDLTTLPFVLQTDRKGRVTRKYMQLD